MNKVVVSHLEESVGIREIDEVTYSSLTASRFEFLQALLKIAGEGNAQILNPEQYAKNILVLARQKGWIK